MHVVAELPLRDSPRLSMMPLKGCNLLAQHRRIPVTVVIDAPVIYPCCKICTA